MEQGLLYPVSLQKLGYDERYILLPCGKVYDTKGRRFMAQYKHNYTLKYANGEFHSVAIRTLYKQAYNKLYVIDDIPSLDDEIWLDISVIPQYKHLEGLYKVSNMGRVKSYVRYKARILKPTNNIDGYYVVEIDRKNVRINRLVLMAFNPTDDETLEADHIDFDRHNNKLSNLQWLDHKQNVARAWDRRNKRKDDYEQGIH